MFEFSQIIDFAKLAPGHAFVQSVLLFMIWWQSKGLRKEIASLRDSFSETKSTIDKRFDGVENRLSLLEKKHEVEKWVGNGSLTTGR